jgi:hypothetical protein
VFAVIGAADDAEAGGEVSVADGELVGDGGGRHAGECGDAVENLALESENLRVPRVAFSRNGQRKYGQIVRLQAGIDLQQAIETLAQQSGTYEKNDRGGQFDHDQVGSELVPDGS